VIVRDYRKNTKSDWVSETISEQKGPVSYRVEVAQGQTWRRHFDQIQESAASISVNQQSDANLQLESDPPSKTIHPSSRDSESSNQECVPPQIQQNTPRSEPRRNPRRSAGPPTRYKDFV
jgi:hypothetical protein